MHITRRAAALGLATTAACTLALKRPAFAASAAALNRDASAALLNLYAIQPSAKILADKAKEVLVFPSIIKAGFVVGAQTGNGTLFRGGHPVNHYNISAASFGLEAGVQSFSYALFFMTDAAVSYLAKSHGWSLGTGPNIVVLDKSAAASVTSSTLAEDVYAIPFGAQGLMAGISIEGSKITEINPGP